MKKIICKICNFKCKNYYGLSNHLRKHKMSNLNYYNIYLKKDNNDGKCLQCKKLVSFISINLGYRKYCSNICSGNYIFENKLYDIKEMVKNVKKTKLKKYGNENYNNSKKISKTKQEKSPEEKLKNQFKMNESKRKNNSFNTSKIEKELEIFLENNNINFKKQYSSNKYPFRCDFYLINHDLYIEINGIWTHGTEPFNVNNKKHLKILGEWEKKGRNSNFYKTAIDIWTNKDVLKRNIAKQNKLNYIEIFSIDKKYCIDKILKHIKRSNNE